MGSFKDTNCHSKFPRIIDIKKKKELFFKKENSNDSPASSSVEKLYSKPILVKKHHLNTESKVHVVDQPARKIFVDEVLWSNNNDIKERTPSDLNFAKIDFEKLNSSLRNIKLPEQTKKKDESSADQ